MKLLCLRGPYDDQWHELEPGKASYFITSPESFWGRYNVIEIDGKLRLVFDPESSPAWANEEFPVEVACGERTCQVWTTKPFGPELENRWMIRDGDAVEVLTEIDVDVDTSYEELKRWVERWGQPGPTSQFPS